MIISINIPSSFRGGKIPYLGELFIDGNEDFDYANPRYVCTRDFLNIYSRVFEIWDQSGGRFKIPTKL